MSAKSNALQRASRETANQISSAIDRENQAFVSVQIPLRLIGLALAASLFLIFISLVTWSVDDPSLSLATDKQPENWLGFFGASIADLSFQLFGLAAITSLFVPSVWAYRLIQRNTPDRFVVKICAWLLYICLCAACFSFFSAPNSWPLPTGLGGLTGNGIHGLIVSLLGSAPTGWTAAFFAFLFVPPTLGLFWLAALQKPNPIEAAQADLSDEESEVEAPAGFFDIVFGGLMHLGLTMGTAWARTRQRFAKMKQDRAAEEAFPTPANDPLNENETDIDSDVTHVHQNQIHAPETPSVEPENFERTEPSFDLSAPPSHTDDYRYGEQTYDSQHTDAALYTQAPEQSYDESVLYPEDYGVDPYAEQEIHPADLDDHNARMSVEASAAPKSQPARATKPNAPTRNLTAPQAAIKQGKRIVQEAQGSLLHDTGFQLPELALLAEPPSATIAEEHLPQNLEANARRLEGVLADFGVKGDIINVRPGPVVTLYELEPAPGIKSSRVISLADDIARSMSAVSARVAVVAGRNAIGIELPNKARETVYLREMLASNDFEKSKGKLNMCLGKTIGGEPIIADLARMPHLLIAGTTGSGKSVAVNTMILSLLYRMTPEQCRLIMIDPKMLELSIYDGIPHLLSPVVTDPSKAVTALKWAVREMEDRYRKMSKIGVRNIDGFNKRVAEAKAKGETITRTVQTGFDRETGEAIYESETFDLEKLPFIVVIVDEMADLMMVAGKDIEGAIQRLAQMARAAGIHLIMATQRPSVDVITGTIKANFPTRISFQVTSKIDSRTILGEQGAEQLLGMGDMLYMAGGGRTKRLHGPFVEDGEVESVVNYLKEQGTPDYLESVTAELEETVGAIDEASGEFSGSGNELYDKAVNIVLNDRKASTSYIQRRLSIGYNRAATLIEQMEEEGVISAANHAGKREILVGDGVD